MKSVCPYFIIAGLLACLFPVNPVFAQVKINEFSSSGSDDWVEIYNDSGETADLTAYSLTDGGGNQVTFTCHLAINGFWTVNWNNKLNNNGDIIQLNKDSQIVDCVTYGDGSGQLCAEQTAATLPKLNEGEFGARNEDGHGGWLVITTSTQDKPNSGQAKDPAATCLSPSPTPQPSPSPQPGSTSSPAGYSSSINSGPSNTDPSFTPSPSTTPSASKIYRIKEINLLNLSPEPVLGTQSSLLSDQFQSKPDRQLATMLLFTGAGIIGVTTVIIIKLWRKN